MRLQCIYKIKYKVLLTLDLLRFVDDFISTSEEDRASNLTVARSHRTENTSCIEGLSNCVGESRTGVKCLGETVNQFCLDSQQVNESHYSQNDPSVVQFIGSFWVASSGYR